MSELDDLKSAFEAAGGLPSALADPGVGHVALSGRSILSMREVEGLAVDARQTDTGIDARLTVAEGARVERPVHLCFGVLGEEGLQEIKLAVRLMKGSAVHFIAHCVFPSARAVRHAMDAAVELEEGAEMRYSEVHLHGPFGGVEVDARAEVYVGNKGRYFADFSLLTGRVGGLGLNYSVIANEGAVAELLARVYGSGDDEIRIMEKVILAGRDARSLVKSRVALKDRARAEITGITEGDAPGARGHVDCMEIVQDDAQARAVPLVKVTHPEAKVTHEAAIGSVDRRQLETLMAHGLGPEEAVDLIVKGILK